MKTLIKSCDDPRIICAVNKKNLGISDSRNKLMDMARGEYFDYLSLTVEIMGEDRKSGRIAC